MLDRPERLLLRAVHARREAWASQTRTGRVRTTPLGDAWPSPAERRKWVAAGRPSLAAPERGSSKLHPNGAFYLGNERMSEAQMRAFDRSGAELFRQLRDGIGKGQGPSLYGEVLVQINDALRNQPAPPKLRAALLRALAFVPGIHYAPARGTGSAARASRSRAWRTGPATSC